MKVRWLTSTLVFLVSTSLLAQDSTARVDSGSVLVAAMSGNAIVGLAVDDSSKRVLEAWITVRPAHDATAQRESTRTDSIGVFRFLNMQSGSYLITIRVIGYYTRAVLGSVTPGAGLFVVARMRAQPVVIECVPLGIERLCSRRDTMRIPQLVR